MADLNRPVAAVEGPRILLVRHGATRLNQKKGTSRDVVRGQANPPLEEKGWREAEVMAKHLSGAGIVELYCSPLTRAAETARIVGEPLHLKPRVVRDLLPWDMGAMTGIQATLAKPALRQYAEQHPSVRIPRGESFLAWERRLLPWMHKLMQHIEHRKVTAACVTHSRCIKLLQGWLAAGQKGNEVDFDVMFRDDTEPCGVYDMRIAENGRWAFHRDEIGCVQK